MLHVTGENCGLAGAVAGNPGVVSDFLELPKPFTARDVTWYFDGQTDGQGALVGNYHAALVCEMGMVGARHEHMLSMGLVGLAVNAPGLNLTPAKHNFLLSTLATSDPTIADAVRSAGFTVYAGQIRLDRGSLLAADVADAVVETAGDGIYESSIHLAQKHAVEPIRYWMVVDGGDGTLRVAALDLSFTPRADGAMYTGETFFSHTQTSKHTGGGTWDATGSLSYLGMGMDLKLRVLPDTTDRMWMH